MLQNLEPNRVWYHFYNISQIPHCSKNEERLINYILELANSLELTTKKDEVGNLLITKPAHSLKTNSPSVCLQSHLDMVCEKNKDTVHDFLKDPLKLKIDNDWLSAIGTTLGADNGIGVAISLALMEDKNLISGPIEFLFTVDEETGLTGAKALKNNFFSSKYLINLDSEEFGTFYIGCAGGINTQISLSIDFETPSNGLVPYILKVQGLTGGHSGGDIHLGRANACKLITRVLYEGIDFIKIATLEGGDKHNAIPREAEAIIYVSVKDQDKLNNLIKTFENIFIDEYKGIEDSISLQLIPYNSNPNIIKEEYKYKILNLLYALPHGVYSMSNDIPDLVETSTNLASIKIENNKFLILTSQRSSTLSKLKDISNKIKAMAELVNGEVTQSDSYPGWKPNLNSKLLNISTKIFKDMFKKEPKVTAIHAGLECGIILEKYPYLDIISIGPTIKNPHSPEERVNIPSVKMFYDYLITLLQNLE